MKHKLPISSPRGSRGAAVRFIRMKADRHRVRDRVRAIRASEYRITNSTGCFLIRRPLVKAVRGHSLNLDFRQDGYIKLKFDFFVDGNKRRTSLFLHHLAKARKDRSITEAQLKGENGAEIQDFSHLCNRRGCFNPKHIVVETHRVNLTRIACFQYENKLCPHVPACIRN